MKIGELFVNLGIKGTDKAQQATQGVRSTLGEIKTSGLAAKAMILGVVYGLQQLMQHSGEAGASLMSYSGATGLSAETLQRWQYAARQANVGAQEMENSITGLQSAMINMAMGHGVPAGMGVISNAVGVDQNRIRDTMYMMGKLAEYAKKEGNVDFANEQLKSFGLSLEMISAMRRGAFNDKTLGSAPIYSDREASQLQKVDVAWSNLGRKFEMAMGHLNAKHGLPIVKELSKLSDVLLKIGDQFVVAAEKAKLFGILGEMFEGIGATFTAISNGLSALNDMMGGEAKDNIVATLRKKLGSKIDDYFDYQDAQNGISVAPAIPKKAGAGGATTNQHISVVNHIQGVKDAKDVGHHVRKEVNRAGQLLNTKGQVN